MQKYTLEFILYTQNAKLKKVMSSLSEFGEGVNIVDLCSDSNAVGRDFKINIIAEDPTLIFDVCSQFGRIKTVKVDEVK